MIKLFKNRIVKLPSINLYYSYLLNIYGFNFDIDIKLVSVIIVFMWMSSYGLASQRLVLYPHISAYISSQD